MGYFIATYVFGLVLLIAAIIIALGTTQITRVKKRYAVRRMGWFPKQFISIFFSIAFAICSFSLIMPIMVTMEKWGVSIGWSLFYLAVITQVPIYVLGFGMYHIMGLVGKKKSKVLLKTCHVLNRRD